MRRRCLFVFLFLFPTSCVRMSAVFCFFFLLRSLSLTSAFPSAVVVYCGALSRREDECVRVWTSCFVMCVFSFFQGQFSQSVRALFCCLFSVEHSV